MNNKKQKQSSVYQQIFLDEDKLDKYLLVVEQTQGSDLNIFDSFKDIPEYKTKVVNEFIQLIGYYISTFNMHLELENFRKLPRIYNCLKIEIKQYKKIIGDFSELDFSDLIGHIFEILEKSGNDTFPINYKNEILNLSK